MVNPQSEEWTDRDFKELSRLIQDSTKTVISPHTLKRLYGKVKYKSNSDPQVATKEALAKFLGYDSWAAFEIKNRDIINKTNSSSKFIEIEKQTKKSTYKYTSLILISLVIIVFLFLTWLLYHSITNSSDKYSFSVNEVSGFVPHSLAFNLKFHQQVPKNLLLDFDFNHPFLNDNFYKILNDNDTTYYYTYQIPGIYRPSLKRGNKIIQTNLVIAKSNGWVAFFSSEKEKSNFWLNNMVSNLPLNKPMTFTREDFGKYGGDTLGVYYTTFRNIRDFNISGDNFIIETRLKNGPETGGVTCFDSNITMLCENDYASLRLLEPNCQAFSRLKFSEIELSGNHFDLSALKLDPSEWMNIRIENNNQSVKIFINGEESFSETYKKELGMLYGLEYRFKGSGIVESILVKTPEGNLVYEEMFN